LYLEDIVDDPPHLLRLRRFWRRQGQDAILELRVDLVLLDVFDRNPALEAARFCPASAALSLNSRLDETSRIHVGFFQQPTTQQEASRMTRSLPSPV
jgi:hypothetical protein